MSLDAESRRLRAKQVGRLIQSYRLEREGRGRGGRLSQKGLLNLMGNIKEGYKDYSHSTVARWETGEILPTRDRLEVFGKALDLPPAEIDGLIALAGLEEGRRVSAGVEVDGDSNARDSVSSSASEVGDTANHWPEGRSYPRVVARFLLPGLGLAGAGYFLASLGWNAEWMLTAYVGVAIAAALSQYFLQLRRSAGLRDLLFVSIFVLLGTTMLQMHGTRMDSYGFYAIGDLASTPVPFVLALLVNLLLAMAAGLIFEFLYRHQYSSGTGNAYRQAATVAFPPVAFVYVCGFILGNNMGLWVYLLEVLPVLGGVLMALLLLRDDRVKVSDRAKWLLIQLTVGLTVLLTTIGLAGTVVVYWDPSLLFMPENNLIFSWENDFNALGYPESEFYDRARVGVVWSALAALVYMVSVVGGSLLVALCRKGDRRR